jgi:thiamine biosynthesis lipoprotein
MMKAAIPILTLMGCLYRGAGAPPESGILPEASITDVVQSEISESTEIDGARVHVRIRCPMGNEGLCTEAARVALNEVQRLIRLSSTWSTQGDVARLNEAAGQGPVEISADVHRLLSSAQIVSSASGGAFDVTIGALSGLWGIEGASLPSDQVLAERLALVDWTALKLGPGTAALTKEGMSITVGGLVQGDAADSALNLIPEDWDALVNVNGDTAVRGEWQVSIPVDDQHGGGEVSLWVSNTVLVASGVRGNGPLDGAIDPRTGRSTPGGSWAVASHKQGAIADALATTLLVTGSDTTVVDQLGAWALLMTDQGWVEVGGRSANVQSWSVAGISP